MLYLCFIPWIRLWMRPYKDFIFRVQGGALQAQKKKAISCVEIAFFIDR
jgi:hypothetical protein